MTPIEATPIADAVQLRQLIERIAGCGPVAVADLSLGSWEPQALELQILGQLTGRELVRKTPPAMRSATISLGDAMSAGIDQEGRGNRALRDAHAGAHRIAAALRRSGGTLLVIAPAFGIAWHREDRLLVEYLARQGGDVTPRFAVLAGSACAWPADWSVTLDAGSEVPCQADPAPAASLAGRLPGTVPPSRLAAPSEAEAVLHLANGWGVVRPELRRAPVPGEPVFTRAEVDALLAHGLRHGAVYALHHGPQGFGDCWVFCHEAWRHFDAGYRALAFVFIERAHATAPDAASAQVFDCHRHSMLLANADFAAAGAAAPPPDDLPDSVRAFLWQTKGWGLVMSGRAEAALPCLRQALALAAPAAPDLPHLLLLNITALAEVRCGHHDAAYALEAQIERTIVEQGIQNARLEFVNWLNLARLERYAGRLDEAERYYRLAFGTVEGARTEADGINVNLSLERLEAARGRPRAALTCRVRAALHWVASACPEALNWRLQSLILGESVPPDVPGLDVAAQAVEHLAAAMLTGLQKAAAACGLELTGDPVAAAAFGSIRQANGTASLKRCLAGDGWAVIAAGVSLPRPHDGPRFRALRAWLTAWVRQGTADAAAGYLIDDSGGGEMPLDAAQVQASALLHGVPETVFDGQRTTLDPTRRAGRLRLRRVGRNPVVARVETLAGRATVHYRRYFPPCTLSDDERALLAASAAEPNVGRLEALLAADGWPAARFERALAGLQGRHVLRVDLPLGEESPSRAVERPECPA